MLLGKMAVIEKRWCTYGIRWRVLIHKPNRSHDLGDLLESFLEEGEQPPYEEGHAWMDQEEDIFYIR